MGTVVKLDGKAYEAPAPAPYPTDPAAALLAAGAAGMAAASWCTAAWYAGLRLGLAATAASLGRPPAPRTKPQAELLVFRPWPKPGALRLCRGRM